MVENIKKDVVGPLLVFMIIKTTSQKDFTKIELFSFPKPKVVYLHLFSSSLLFSKFGKQNFMLFGHKHVET